MANDPSDYDIIIRNHVIIHTSTGVHNSARKLGLKDLATVSSNQSQVEAGKCIGLWDWRDRWDGQVR